jgi:DNA-binding response OmpR family regulator
MAILLIEDDIDLSNLLIQYLEINSIEVIHAADGKSAMELFTLKQPELVIIDVMLPDLDGFELAKILKNKINHIPFLFLTAKNKKEDIVSGLKLGADDYITKPFNPEELVLRINVILRRQTIDKGIELVIGNSKLYTKEFKLKTPKKEYKLTQKESDLLAFIIRNKNQLIKREIMLKSIWGENDYFLGRSMDVFISRLRKFFSDDAQISIETLRGIGYIFKDNIAHGS